jgi:mono/diheme cytochrome c family protein
MEFAKPSAADHPAYHGRTVALALLTLFGLTGGAQAADVTYADIEPVLSSRCIVCHAGDSPPIGLHLDSFNGLIKGGTRGPVVKAGKPQESELIRRLKGINQPRMPMNGPPYLSNEQIALFEAWIKQGLAASLATGSSSQPRKAVVGGRR